MKIKAHFILLFILSLYCQISFAQEYKVFDPFTNEEYTYKTFYNEEKDLELNKDKEIDIDYFAMRNSNGRNYDKINAYIAQLALEEWKSKEKKFEVNNEVNAHLVKYNAFINRSNSYYNKESKHMTFDLKAIQVDFISVCEGKITFKKSFRFQISSRTLYDTETAIEHYYVADLLTQKVNELKPQFNEKQIGLIDKVLTPYLNEYTNRLVEKNSPHKNYNFDYDDESDGGETVQEEAVEVPVISDEVPTNDYKSYNDNTRRNNYKTEEVISPSEILNVETENTEDHEMSEIRKREKKKNKFDVSDAHYYWFAWGLMIKFPAFSKSTYLNNGKSFSIFVPFNEAKSILELIPTYASFSKLIQPAHQFNNFDYFKITNSYSQYRQEPSVTALFTFNNAPEKPKKLIVGSYQLFENDKKNYRGNFIYEFDVNSKSFQQEASIKSYSLYEEKVGERFRKRENNYDKSNDILKFDERGNLIFKKNTASKNEFNHQYFYNESFCYHFSYTASNLEPLEKIALKNGEICIKDVCLSLNKNFKVDAVKMLKYQHNDVQIGFDERDRLIEAHSENDRYNYYYEYDAQDRLIKYSYYEYQKLEKEVVFFYKDNKKLPYLQKRQSLTNKTFEEETYDWEY